MRSKLTVIFTLMTAMFVVVPAHAQTPDCKPISKPGRDLITIPEIKSQGGKLQGSVILSDEGRAIPENEKGDCYWQTHIRFFKGFSLTQPKPWPSTGDPIPGPTLRARVGDLIELTFLNQIDPKNFPNTLDQSPKNEQGCDIATAQRTDGSGSTQIYPRNDVYPNCMHGSSTANLHFHGTHTTPSTTGDNVLLFNHPALRTSGKIEPDDGFVKQQFSEFFKWCEQHGSPTKFDQLPLAWRQEQEKLLKQYDATAPYLGQKATPGHPALPVSLQLWPANNTKIQEGKWPQYSIGAFPYCYRLPEYDPAKVKMGQAPGTQWYHAHKHGSTALNVGNGMTGAFIIEGAYDDQLRQFYKDTPQHKNWGLEERVLVIQQLEAGLNLMSGGKPASFPNKRPAPIEVNGRLNPVVTMRPNQVQLWRIVNSAPRNFVQFDNFTKQGKAPNQVSVAWRQIAQDGVQFRFENYQRFGTINAKFNLATANRADLLVKAPALEGNYALQVIQSVSDLPAGTPVTLLTVRVKADGKTIEPPMDFIKDERDFPKFPPFLNDIYGPIYKTRNLDFNTSPKSGRGGGAMPLHEINDKLFNDDHVDQEMILNTTEEWKISNRTVNIAHPFHIHINPFQIVEVFQPNSAEAKDSNGKCYADPTNPETWKPCHRLPAPWVWWDTFAIPTGRQNALPASVCTELDKCPADLQEYTSCASGTCTVTIPGYFKMRSRFVDFTGQYVLHCHILAHEDRGMMELVAVVEPKKNEYTHH